ncbi:hypothetical protein [Mycobacteroides chelonae]|uniref:hypothetical protein n=1 Tax=Mycobacteroides chelonae TaxID=1774 RepID=UPI000994709F|nr:hypothetical protein [Mycobacteroides chelonae]
MSQLDVMNAEVVVHPQVDVVNRHQNTTTKASDTGIETPARIQVASSSGTSARRAEQDNEGFESEVFYRIRFPRSFDNEHGILGMQSQIYWEGKKYGIFGIPQRYMGSPRTAHIEYLMQRS